MEAIESTEKAPELMEEGEVSRLVEYATKLGVMEQEIRGISERLLKQFDDLRTEAMAYFESIHAKYKLDPAKDQWDLATRTILRG